MAQTKRNGELSSGDNKYREYIRRLREFLKNEINKVLNRLINLYKSMKLIIEKLDFRNPKLCKRMNYSKLRQALCKGKNETATAVIWHRDRRGQSCLFKPKV